MAKRKVSQKKAVPKAQKTSALKSSAKKSGKPLEQAVLDPQFRAVMFRPERHDYVRHQYNKNKSESQCVFCEAARGDLSTETLKVWQSDLTMILLNKFPYNTGHLLVLPRRHVGNMEDLSAQEATELVLAVQTSVRILKEAYTCTGLNVGMNLGSTAGAGIPGHLHAHIVPRWAGDTNFFPLLAQTKVVIERLEDTFTRLLPLFQQVKVI